MEIDSFHSLEKNGLFEKFAQQLRRDFELSGYLSYLQEINSHQYNDVFDKVFDALLKIEKYEHNGIMNLLYRIDISERQIKQASREYPHKSFEQVVAGLIIKRILQKVIIKQHYSS